MTTDQAITEALAEDAAVREFGHHKIVEHEMVFAKAALLGVQNVNAAIDTVDQLRQQLADVTNERDALLAERQWIKCSTQMPDLDKRVMAVDCYGDIGCGHFFQGYSGVHFSSDGGERGYEISEPTHWMPLPLPPEGE